MYRRLVFPLLVLSLCLSPAARAANIILVTETRDTNVDGVQDDIGLEEFLRDRGHTVDVRRGNWTTLDAAKIAELNAADLIIVSRSTNSGNYDDDATEIAAWNNLTPPMILAAAHLARGTSSGFRWYWFNSTSVPNLVAPKMQVVETAHPIFRGVALDANNQVDALDGTIGTGQTTFVGTTDVGNGTLLARTATGTNSWIVEWQAGTPYYAGSPQTPAGKRMFFAFGTQESGATPQGAFNLTATGRQILANMISYLLGRATGPVPENGAEDVSRYVMLSWTPLPSAVQHDVYFGTSLEDVSAATRVQPLGVLVSRGQDANTYEPAFRLDLDQTYYWRIDEVGPAPDSTISRGEEWSFTSEPSLYTMKNILATASSSDPSANPANTIDGSGLDADGLHSTDTAAMWFSSDDGPQPVWIQYEFDGIYKLHEMWVWNYNATFEGLLGFGFRNTTIEYSIDGMNWTMLGDREFAQGTTRPGYAHDAPVDFGSVAAKYVRLTAQNNWSGVRPQCGLSEVKFVYVRVHPTKPEPASGTTEVHPGAVLSWRAGCEAASHEVYLNSDMEAVANGTALAGVVTENRFDLATANVAFGQTYYWKVVEVNDAETPGAWPGDIWSFSTLEFESIDDFEGYTNESPNRIFQRWIDGLPFSQDEFFPNGSPGNGTGAAGGHDIWTPESPHYGNTIMEATLFHGGEQSMPLYYDNASADKKHYSEIERAWDTPQDWSRYGADTLRLHVLGSPQAFVEDAGRIVMNGAGTDIWAAADQFSFAQKPLNGDGSITVRVDSVENTTGWAKAGVMIRESMDADSKNALAYVTADGRVGWQYRELTAGTSSSTRTEPAAVAFPHWVRITRTGNTIKAEHSADGVTWEPMIEPANPAEPTFLDFAMSTNVFIGLAVTSHTAGVACTTEFSQISASVPGVWQFLQIGVNHPFNEPEDLYVALQDWNNRLAVVSYPNGTIVDQWTPPWDIPLGSFTGVNLTAIKKMYIGVGNRNTPKAGSTGLIYLDDIVYGRAVPAGMGQ